MKHIVQLSIIAVCLCCSVAVYAQEQRNKSFQVIINNVVYSQKEQKTKLDNVLGTAAQAILTGREYQYNTQRADYRDAVLAAIVRGMSTTHRIRVVDGTNSMAGLMQQHDFDMDVMVANIATSSRTVVETVKEKKDGKETERKVTNTYHKGILDVTLQMKNVGTGEVVCSPAFNFSGSDYDKNRTGEEALSRVLESLSYYVSDYFNKMFPMVGRILEGATAKKDKQKEVYIDLGSDDGAYKGLHLAVYILKTIAGNEAREQIGKLKISDVQGNHVSLCKVQSGSKDIKAALDAGKNVVVLTTD